MKTKEELLTLKSEAKALGSKFSELSEEELQEVTGGLSIDEFLAQMGILTFSPALGSTRPLRDNLRDNMGLREDLREDAVGFIGEGPLEPKL